MSLQKLLHGLANPTSAKAMKEAEPFLNNCTEGSNGGVVIPTRFRSKSGKRDFTTTAQGGNNLIETEIREPIFEYGYDSWLLDNITTLTGLTNSVEIPKENNAIEAGWITEGGTATEVDPTFVQESLTPHVLSTYVDISRQLLASATVSASDYVEYTLRRELTKALSEACLWATPGSGIDFPNSHAPDGWLKNVSSIPVWANYNGNVLTTNPNVKVMEDGMVDKEKALANGHIPEENIKFLFSPQAAHRLMHEGGYLNPGNTAPTAGDWRPLLVRGEPLWGQYPWHAAPYASYANVTGQSVSKYSFIAGDFSSVYLGLFGDGLELLVNEYVKDINNQVRITALLSCDFAFSYSGNELVSVT